MKICETYLNSCVETITVIDANLIPSKGFSIIQKNFSNVLVNWSIKYLCGHFRMPNVEVVSHTLRCNSPSHCAQAVIAFLMMTHRRLRRFRQIQNVGSSRDGNVRLFVLGLAWPGA